VVVEGPLVSVIIPTRNRRHTLEAAVRSVQGQTVGDLEVIVADDASDDGTEELVGSLAALDPRVKYLRGDSRRGAQAARNMGIQAAKGAWIGFLDSDDVYLPESLARRLAYASGRVSVVHSECLARLPDRTSRPFGVPPMAGDARAALLVRPGPVFPALLVKSDTLRSIGQLDESLMAYQEWDTSIRLAAVAEFAFVSEPTFVYNVGTPGSISSDLIRSAQGYECVVRKHWRAMLTVGGPELLARHMREAARQRATGAQHGRAAARLIAAALLWPIAARTNLRLARSILAMRRGARPTSVGP
jgi:glycosyltransferase involved in cell wall biosynthesis